MTSVNSKIADASVHHQVDLLRIEAGLERDVLKLMQGLSGDLSALLAKKGAWAGDDIPGDMKRIQKLQKQSDAIIDDLYGKLNSETTSEMKDAARYAAEWVPSAINTAIGANIADVTLTTELLNSVVKNTLVEGAPSAAWWAKQSGDLKLNFMREMRTGILQGENLSDLTRRIRGRRENGYADGLLPPGKDATTGRTIRATMRPATRNAQALAITSVQQVMGDARMEAYRQNSDLIKGVQQISTLDGRTSPVCRAYDHAAWDLEGNPLPGFPDLLFNGGPPRHFRCRSVLVPICKSWEELGAKGVKDFPPGSRASMDGQVADHIDYETWLKGKPEAFQREVLGPSRYDLWQNGKVNLRDMVDQRGRPVRVKELADGYVPDTPLGKSLAKTEAEIRPLRYERALVFNQDGTIFFERNGTSSQVIFSGQEFETFTGKVFTHNHPGNTSFSEPDVHRAAEYGLSEMRAVSTEYTHSIKPPESGWRKDMWYDEIYPEYRKAFSEVRKENDKLVTEGVISQTEAGLRRNHEIWKRVAAKTGLIYSREAYEP